MVCLSLFTQVIGATSLFVQHVLAFHHYEHRVEDPISKFVVQNRPVALQGILDNIGPDGAKVVGAGPGLVIASPSKADPDCKQAISLLSLS